MFHLYSEYLDNVILGPISIETSCVRTLELNVVTKVARSIALDFRTVSQTSVDFFEELPRISP